MRAARLMLAEMRRRVAGRESFAFETTLSGRAYLHQIPQWQAADYHVNLIFLRLRSVRLAIARVKTRVSQGGHAVPATKERTEFLAKYLGVKFKGKAVHFVIFVLFES